MLKPRSRFAYSVTRVNTRKSKRVFSIQFIAGPSLRMVIFRYLPILLLAAAFAAPPAWADTVSQDCPGHYTLTVTSDGPNGSLALGGNCFGLIVWTDVSNHLSYSSGPDAHSLSLSRNYVVQVVADPGFSLTQLSRYHSDSYGPGNDSAAQLTEGASLNDLSSATIAPFSPCGFGGKIASVGCQQTVASYYDQDNECCMVFNFDSSNYVSGTGPIPLPGKGFILDLNTSLWIGGPADGNMNYGFGEFPGHGPAFQIDMAPVTTSPVPEPSAVMLLGSALLLTIGGKVAWGLHSVRRNLRLPDSICACYPPF